jgi:hypothetical protein
MTAKYRLLLTAALLLGAICNLKAQEPAYDHKIIAILPFKTQSYKVTPRSGDSAVQRLLANEAALSIEVQEAFYNAITSDSERLLVEVQDWKLTDSLLRAAGIDFRKINFSDKQVLAALLKVDAVLVGELSARRTNEMQPEDVAAMTTADGAAFTGLRMYEKTKRLIVSLYDGKTGDPLWNFERELTSHLLFRHTKNLDAKLYKSFIKRFPYTQ